MKKILNILNNFLFKIKKKQHQRETFKKVLVVSNTALGDTILSTPVIKTLRKSFPDIYIAFMVNKNVYPLFKDYEYANDVIIYQKNLFGLIKHVYYLRKNKFDSIFFIHSNGPQDLFMALLSNINNLHKAINYPNKISTEFASLIKNKINSKKYQHIREHRLDAINYLNPKTVDKTINIPKKFYYQPAKSTKKILIGIQLGAADKYKMWPIKNFIELINKIHKKNMAIKIALLGIKSEQILAQQITKNAIYKKNIFNYCGKTSIEELPSLINSLDLLITNDTGTLHLAIALKRRSISLFSPTDSKIFGPYQDPELHSVIQKNGNFINNKPKKERNQDAMNMIKVNEVYKITKQHLDRINICVE